MRSLRSIGSLRRGVFYGWWIVVGGFLIQVLISGLVQRTFSLYFVLLQGEFGWSRALLSVPFSFAQAESGGLLGPLQGWLLDKFGPRAVMRVGVVILGASLIAMSQVHSMGVLFTTVLLVGMGLGLVGYLTLTTIVANWFERRRNTAIALTQSGMGVGGLFLPVVALALAAFGWRSVAFSSGIFVLVLGLPIAQLMRHKPEAYGLLPDGDAPPDASGEEANTEGPEQGDGRGVAPSPRIAFTARQALRTPTFWLLAMGHGMAVFVGNGLSLHLIAHIVARLGISLGAAAGVITLIPVVSIGAQVIGGYVGDRVNKRILAALCMVGIAVSLVLFAFGEGLGMLLGAAMVNGVAQGVRGPLMPSIRADYFGRGSFGTIMGFTTLLVMFGTLTGPVLVGVIADWQGDYRGAFLVLAAVALAGSFFFVAARRPKPPQPSSA